MWLCLAWHSGAEALAVLGSVCDVGAVMVFAFHSHQWLVSSFLLFSLPLAGFFAPCDDLCLHVSWVQQDSLFHQGLSSLLCCTDSAWVEWVSAAQPFNLLLALFTKSLISDTSYSHSFPLSYTSYLPALHAATFCPDYLLCHCFLSPNTNISLLIPVG